MHYLIKSFRERINPKGKKSNRWCKNMVQKMKDASFQMKGPPDVSKKDEISSHGGMSLGHFKTQGTERRP